jgi:threonyl-tRNA synthetase
LGKRINATKAQHVPYIIVLGDKEIEKGTLTVETRGDKIGDINIDDFIAKVQQEITDKTLG